MRYLVGNPGNEVQLALEAVPIHISYLTCHLSIVLFQLMDLAPLGPILLVDVDLVVIGTQGNL